MSTRHPSLAPIANRALRLFAAGVAAFITAAASAADWLNSLTYVHAPAFNRIDVLLAGLDGPPQDLAKIEDFILQGDFGATAAGYFVAGTPANPPSAGATILMSFTAPATASFDSAELWNDDTLVGIMDSAGVVTSGGEVVGEFVVWMAPPAAGEVKPKTLAQIANWGATLNNPPPGGIAAHATAMAALYDDDATLLPTVGTYNLYQKAVQPTIESYFKDKFLKLKPLMVPINPANVHVVRSPDKLMTSANGLYTFITTVGPCGAALPKPALTRARFTFVFTRASRTAPWTIVQHHSSKDPGAKAPCPGNLNDDCKVDGFDLGILLANWGDCP